MLTAFFLNALLVSIRLVPLIVVSPIIFFVRIPLTVRLLLALALAGALASAIAPGRVPSLTVAVLLGELLLGAVMAFGFHAAQAGLDMVGKLIDTQIGLNAAGIFDPGTSSMTGIIAELLVLSFALLFVTLDMHHALLRVFSQVLVVIPPGSVSIATLSVSLAAVLTQQFLLAFMIMVPVILGLWLIDVAFAFLSRSMPQANIYFLSLPIKLAMGVLILLLSLPMIVQRLPLLIENALRFSASPAGAP